MAGHTYPHCRVSTHPEWYPTESILPRVLGGKSMDERIEMRKRREAQDAADRARWAAGEFTLFEAVCFYVGMPILAVMFVGLVVGLVAQMFLFS